MAMKCPSCAMENPEIAKFCLSCGTKMPELPSPQPPPVPSPTKNCVQCGRVVASYANLCPYCGHDFRVQFPRSQVRNERVEDRLTSVARSALQVGFAVLVISIALFVLSEVLEDRANDMLLEGDFNFLDMQNMADLANTGAWIALFVAIPCIVGGAIAYQSYKM